MKLREVVRILEGTVLTNPADLDRDIPCAAGADLMSDVLAFGKPKAILLTGLTHPQVVRTAEMADFAAVVFVRGKMPPTETLALARERGIPLVTTQHTLFETCGRLYEKGMAGCEI